MEEKISIELIDELRQDVARLLWIVRNFAFLSYADVRLEINESQGAAAENGEAKASGRAYRFSFGIRVIAGVNVQAAGYFGQALGAADLDKFHVRLMEGFVRA
jgi:predicted Zn-dependent protease